jgi:hypothetical protein
MEARQGTSRRLKIYWFTVSYKQVFLWVLTVVIVAALGGFAFFRDYVLREYQRLFESETESKGSALIRSGRFISIAGSVKVKRANSVQWVTADPKMPLEAGDYIQTSSDSYANIIFPEGTTYKMKPDSLIVVQENSEDPQTLARKVSVRVSSGAIDLSTAKRDVAVSRSQVSAASATAQVDQDSRMAVESNPNRKTASFIVQRGSAKVLVGRESYSLGPYEKATVEPVGLTKEKILAPPALQSPNDIKPVITRNGPASKVEFTWSPVPQAVAYRIRISNSSIFSNILKEEVVRQITSYVTSGLEEGTYYWAVSSIDAKRNVSRESDPNKFILIIQPVGNHESDLYLSILKVTQIANIFEIIGRTDPGATVMINEEPVPLMSADGTFKHFTSPLPHKGKNIITVTAQDRSGNSKTIRREVYIE